MANPELFNGVGSPQSIYQSSSDEVHTVGTVGYLGEDRFVYAKAGAVALAPGKIAQAAALVANHIGIAAAAAAAAGDKTVTVTLGATAATANQYQDGKLVVEDDAGEAHAYKIKSHPAASGAASLVVTLYDEVAVAMTTSTTVALLPARYNGLVIGATAQTGVPAGVARTTITAAEYGWVQVSGECPVLADEAITAGNVVTFGSSVAGSVEVVDAVAEAQIGVARDAITDTEYGPVALNIA